MGKGADTPNVVGAAKETGEQAMILNEAQTQANRPNQTNAWGSTQWENTPVWNPVTGTYQTQWTQTETLNPLMQQSLDSQQSIQAGRSALAEGVMARAWDDYSQPVDFDQYGNPIQMGDVESAGRFEADPGTWRQQAEDAAYQRSTSRLDPQFQAQEQQLLTRLRNQGLQPGDQAYDAAMSNFQRGRNDAYEQARLGATSEGRTEAGQFFGQQLQGYQTNLGAQGQEFGQAVQQNQIANQLRTQQIQEDLARRGYSLSEVERLLQGQGIQGGPPTSGGQTTTENSTYVGNLLAGEQ